MRYAVWKTPGFERPVWARIISENQGTVRVKISKNWEQTVNRSELICVLSALELDIWLRQERDDVNSEH